MSTQHFIRLCMKPTCRFRFHTNLAEQNELCPKCGSPTRLVENPHSGLNSDDKKLKNGPEIHLVLDNIRSAFNVGSILRTCDGAGISHVHICGITPTPDQAKVAKTALGAEEFVPWSQSWNAKDVVEEALREGAWCIALEAGPKSVPIQQWVNTIDSVNCFYLIAGNEVSGVDTGILDCCQSIVRIPMYGQKNSLNVAVALGIAVYSLVFKFFSE